MRAERTGRAPGWPCGRARFRPGGGAAPAFPARRDQPGAGGASRLRAGRCDRRRGRHARRRRGAAGCKWSPTCRTTSAYTVRGGEAQRDPHRLPRATSMGWLSVAGALAAIVTRPSSRWAAGWRWPPGAAGRCRAIGGVAAGGAGLHGGLRPIAHAVRRVDGVRLLRAVAVVGSDWVLTGGIGPVTVPAGGFAIGGCRRRLLAVNNHRDIAHDRQVGGTPLPSVWRRGSVRLLPARCGCRSCRAVMAWMAASPGCCCRCCCCRRRCCRARLHRSRGWRRLQHHPVPHLPARTVVCRPAVGGAPAAAAVW